MSIGWWSGCTAGAGIMKKTVSVGSNTYIRTLLTLELGNGLLRRAGVKADLKKQVRQSAN